MHFDRRSHFLLCHYPHHQARIHHHINTISQVSPSLLLRISSVTFQSIIMSSFQCIVLSIYWCRTNIIYTLQPFMIKIYNCELESLYCFDPCVSAFNALSHLCTLTCDQSYMQLQLLVSYTHLAYTIHLLVAIVGNPHPTLLWKLTQLNVYRDIVTHIPMTSNFNTCMHLIRYYNHKSNKG